MERVHRPPYRNFTPGNFPKRGFDVCELKRDGWFTRLDIEEGLYKLYSRTSRLLREGSINLSIRKTVLYSEYLFGTEWAKSRSDYGSLAVFGAEFIDGEDLRKASLAEVYLAVEDFLRLSQAISSIGIVSDCSLVEQYPVEDAPKIWKEYVGDWTSYLEGTGYEGLVFKNTEAPWGAEMGRMKQIASMDYVCMDVLESTSATYAGWGAQSLVGGLYVKGRLMKVCKVSGMTDEQRKDFLQNKKSYVGRVFECIGKKISKKGAVRHPNFIRWRDDKDPEECTW